MVECEYTNYSSGSVVLLSFNRYMVECELVLHLQVFVNTIFVLIDTWWNVNQSFGEEQLKEALF